MANTADKVLSIAEAEIGYLEKKSNALLDDKTANAGYSNYTKYGRDMHNLYPSVMDFPAAWCDCFVDWCFYKAYGTATAKSLLCGNFDDYTVASAQMYKNKKAWYTSDPKPGDQIFFTNAAGGICHTGLVYKVSNGTVYTIEGNTSTSGGVVANGGCVAKKTYAVTYSRIAGYGRPKYDIETKYSRKKFIKEVQKVLGVAVTGTADSATLSKTITVSRSKNNKHAVVKPIQKYLNLKGFDCGEADGIAGEKFDKAVRELQKSKGYVADGKIKKGEKIWKWMLGLN